MNTLGTADVVSDMNTLGTGANVTNMNTLAGIASNITTVAGISSNVSTVAGISANVTTVATNEANVNNRKGNLFIFPSYLMHRVTPVTKGTRKSLVIWAGGPQPLK